jgi:hypothetical protein
MLRNRTVIVLVSVFRVTVPRPHLLSLPARGIASGQRVAAQKESETGKSLGN